MSKYTLPAKQWPKILAFIRECPHVYVGQEANCKLFIEAVVWVMRSGSQWRQLPNHYGKWNSVYKRFARWVEHGVWEHMHQHFTSDPDLASVIIDSTVVRAHSCAAGAQKKRRTSRASPRQKPGRVQHQSPPLHRCTRHPAKVSTHPGTSPRSNPSRGVNRWG